MCDQRQEQSLLWGQVVVELKHYVDLRRVLTHNHSLIGESCPWIVWWLDSGRRWCLSFLHISGLKHEKKELLGKQVHSLFAKTLHGLFECSKCTNPKYFFHQIIASTHLLEANWTFLNEMLIFLFPNLHEAPFVSWPSHISGVGPFPVWRHIRLKKKSCFSEFALNNIERSRTERKSCFRISDVIVVVSWQK